MSIDKPEKKPEKGIKHALSLPELQQELSNIILNYQREIISATYFLSQKDDLNKEIHQTRISNLKLIIDKIKRGEFKSANEVYSFFKQITNNKTIADASTKMKRIQENNVRFDINISDEE